MRHGLRIEPLDVLFFRDGRPFEPATHASSGMPLPQTLAGALRTALLARLGFDFAGFSRVRQQCHKIGQEGRDALKLALHDAGADERVVAAKFRGPWLAVFPWNQAVPLLPQPLDLMKAREGDRFVLLQPRREGIAGWKDPDGLLPPVRDGETDNKAGPRMFTLPAIESYLRGQTAFAAEELFETKDIYGYENRTGIGVDAETLTAAESMIYGIRFLALRRNIANEATHGRYAKASTGLYAEIDTEFSRTDLQNLLQDPVPLGGESRHVRVVVSDPVSWPQPPRTKSTRWLLASPAFLPRSEKSQRPLPAISGLRAALSNSGLAVSGWDVARRGPRPTRFAIPAGAVYYFDGPGPEDGFLGGSVDDRMEGWGFALPGVWEEKHG